MPIYEYRCADCGIHVEKRQSVNDPPLSLCDACGGRLEKQWSLSGFQFKGEGWYVTDYSKNKDAGKTAEKAAGTGGEKSSAAESTSETPKASNESKPEKKAEPAAKKSE